MKKYFFKFFIMVAAIGFLATSCSENPIDTSTVVDVTVSPATSSVERGKTQAFTATVSGTNNPAQTVTWSIVETGKKEATFINDGGVLIISSVETLTSLTVKATSTVDNTKSGTAIITVTGTITEPDPEPEEPEGLTATQIVNDIKIGWNLGNTLDATSNLGAGATVLQLETAWVKTQTTKANIDALKDAGFNAIRIPVSWAKCADANYNIRADWMARVKEIVDYVVANDMYIILNTHHDEHIFRLGKVPSGTTDKTTPKPVAQALTPEEKEESLKAFKKVWGQIAETFKNYDEKLIFEGLNEPRTPNSAGEWVGGTPEERNNLNAHYQAFVDVVRASGGNNRKRVLMVNTYAASKELVAINALKIPKDVMKEKIIVSIHAYEPYNFALNTNMAFNKWDKNNSSDVSAVKTPIDRAYDAFVKKGIPVILGEFGAMNKNNTETRAEWAKYSVDYAKGKNIPYFWWDNCNFDGGGETFGLLDRKTNTFLFPEIIKALTGVTVAGPDPSITVITLNPNAPYGWQSYYESSNAWYGNKIEAGDVITFTYSFKSNMAMDHLEIALIDASPAANWWAELSGFVKIEENIAANTEYSGTAVLTATKSSSGTSAAANRLVFATNTTPASGPTLTFTTFSIVKN